MFYKTHTKKPKKTKKTKKRGAQGLAKSFLTAQCGNALCLAGSAAPTTLLFLQFERISVLNILSYLRNYWANRPECQRVVLSR
jgi:hypothetical protein